MRKWRIVLATLSIISLFSCSGSKKNLKVIDLQEFGKNQVVALEDRYNEYFTESKAIFLDKTDSFSPEDVKQIVSIKNDIYILIKSSIRRYDLITGHLDNNFQTYESIFDFISFDIDKANSRIYALDAKYSKIIIIDTAGKILDELKLDPVYKYDQLAVLDKSHILISTCSLPVSVTFVADIEEKNIKQIDPPSSKSFNPDKELYDTILKKIAPINIFCRSDSGVLVKYLFEDIVYRYNSDSKNPEFFVKIKRGNKPKLNKKSISTKLGQNTLTGLWQLSEDKWLLRWSQVWKRNESLTLMHFFTVCNDKMGVYNDSMSYNTTIMEWYMSGTIFSIGAYDKIYVDTKEKMLFKIMSNDLSGNKLPEYLNDHKAQNDLILCYYRIK